MIFTEKIEDSFILYAPCMENVLVNNSVRLQLQIWTPHNHYKHYKRYYLKHNTEAMLRQGGDRVYEVSRGEEEKGEEEKGERKER